LGIVSRLDAPVTGVVLLARTSKAAGRLSKQFRERDVQKTYWAIVEGQIEPPEGTLVNYLRKGERHRRMHVTGANAPGAQRAELTYRVFRPERERMGEGEIHSSHSLPLFHSPTLVSFSLLEVRPQTGRKHQIRVQLSEAGFPIVGDRKYGSTRAFPTGIALHSRRLVIELPVSKMQVEMVAPLPQLGSDLLGSSAKPQAAVG
jgi:23S rRNA pseudouridine1911/1915/1917 synthase